MPVDSGEKVQDFCSVLVLTDKQTSGGYRKSDPQQVAAAVSTYLTVQENKANKMCSDVLHVGCHRSPENLIAFGPCGVDVDMEKGNLEKVKINEESGGGFISLTKALRRQNSSSQTGGDATRPFVNQILMLLKLDPKDKQATMERGSDSPNNSSKWRKYKRPTAAFHSRHIVLLFSILSSMGTIVLIYLTLRVRQAAGESFILG